ncbi:MerR family transcriptional regulator [Paenibacillus brevis]|uniref:MerR family transcriptional regulator n=1 Tax=Paenibacillus brevis TaxID=2841508 RepID=A0ABS6FWV6_9BACL|nr:MerR family transcriptional regulator [Paenibacillus brevis]MBU5674721.1 MerR family transcriptional regulator [Paenibacillus brevis]
MLRIGDFSKLSRISIRMLRHYDEIGLLVPESVDCSSGYRYYSEGQLMLANRIDALKSMGFSLSMIAQIMMTCKEPGDLKQYLDLKQAEMMEQAEKIDRQLLLLETTIRRLGEEEYFMEYSVTLKEMPQRTVASLRKIIPAYDQEGLLWGLLTKELEGQQVQLANPCYSLAIFHDEGYKENDVDVEIQISVDGSYQDTENVKFKTVPPVLVASAVYKGGYEQITPVNQAVAAWIRDNQYNLAESMFSIYHVSPAIDPNPENWVTEVCYPVIPK